jgi:spermidine synthase
MTIHWLKRLVSYAYPVTLQRMSSTQNPVMFLKLFQNQLLLNTTQAVYSFGTSYRPYLKMFEWMKKDLPHVKTFLVLGTGLGSALAILQEKYQCFPQTDLVDHDEVILRCSAEWMNLNTHHNVNWHATDARHFLQSTNQHYDLIAIDIFNDLHTPDVYLTSDFFQLVKQCLSPTGKICLNTIPGNPTTEASITANLNALFSSVQKYPFAQNVFYICSNS